MAESSNEFAYHRSITPNLAVLLSLALIDTLVVHLVAVAVWGWTVALMLGAIDIAAVVALLRLLHMIRRRPVTLRNRILTMRLGNLKVVPIPVSHVQGLRAQWDAALLRAPSSLNLALATWPNVVIALDPPIFYRRRRITVVAHKLDDVAAFSAAIDALVAAETPGQ